MSYHIDTATHKVTNLATSKQHAARLTLNVSNGVVDEGINSEGGQTM